MVGGNSSSNNDEVDDDYGFWFVISVIEFGVLVGLGVFFEWLIFCCGVIFIWFIDF